MSFYLLSFAQRIWPAVKVLACAASAASWRWTVDLAWDSLPATSPMTRVSRGLEEWVWLEELVWAGVLLLVE